MAEKEPREGEQGHLRRKRHSSILGLSIHPLPKVSKPQSASGLGLEMCQHKRWQ